MSDASRILAPILLIAVPTIEFGVALLGMLTGRTPGYLDNPLRQNMFRAGHAHARVVAGVRSGGPAVAGPVGPRRALEVDRPDRVRGGTDSHAAWLLPFGDSTCSGTTVSSDWCTRPVSPLALER